MKLTATVSPEGRLPTVAQMKIKETLDSFIGKAVSVEIKSVNPISLDAYRYLFGVVYHVAAIAFGDMNGDTYTTDDMDYLFKKKYWVEPYLNPETKEIEKRVRSKTEFSKEEQLAYIDNVIKYIESRLGVTVPPPESAGDTFIHNA